MRASKVAVLSYALLAGRALAADVQINSTAAVTASPMLAAQPGQASVAVPVYALVGLDVRHLEVKGFDDLSLSVSGWGSANAGNASLGGDVNVAYLDGVTFSRHLRVRIGRQLVTGGVARFMAIDGISVQVNPVHEAGASAYVGMPVQPRFATFFRGDLAVGGRVFWAPTSTTEVGVSIVRITDKTALVRQDVGADARWLPFKSVSLAGAVMWSLADMRLAELDLGPRWQPIPEIEIRAGYRRTAPDLFLARDSIFTVFADTTRDELGGSVSWQPHRALSLTGDAHAVWLEAVPGYDIGLIAQLKPLRSSAFSLTAQGQRLAIPSNGFTRGRIAARYTLPFGLGLSADFEAYVLDTTVREQNASFTFGGTATYDAGRHWLIGLAVLTGVTPLFEHRTEVMAKVTYVLPGAS